MAEIIVKENPDHKKNEVSFEERERELKEQEKREEEARKREKNSTFNEFAQFNMEGYVHTGVMMSLADYPAATKLFWFIAKQMDGYNALIASYAVFQEALNMSIPTIARGVKVLKEKGILHIKKSGSANVYIMNPDLIWKSWSNNKQYCEFPAKVILSASEQFQGTNDFFTKQMHRVLDKKDRE